MKQGKWLAAASMLAIMTIAIEGWPAWRELSQHKEWRSSETTSGSASMHGLQVSVDQQIAAIAAQRPERAALLIRLALRVTPDARKAWTDCRVSLHHDAGQTWLPLTSASADGAIKALSPDHQNFGLCRLYSHNESTDNETLLADQLFLLPSTSVQGLRLHVSGLGTRPQALSFALNPEVRQLP